MDWKFYIDELVIDQLAVIALPLFLLVIVLEVYLTRHEQKEIYNKKDTLVSLSMLIATAIVEFVPKVLAFAAFNI